MYMPKTNLSQLSFHTHGSIIQQKISLDDGKMDRWMHARQILTLVYGEPKN